MYCKNMRLVIAAMCSVQGVLNGSKWVLMGPNVMQSGKTLHMVQNWYFELLVSHENLNYPLFRTFYSDLLWLDGIRKVTDIHRLSKIKKNIRFMLLISFIWHFHAVKHVTGFLRSCNKLIKMDQKYGSP